MNRSLIGIAERAGIVLGILLLTHIAARYAWVNMLTSNTSYFFGSTAEKLDGWGYPADAPRTFGNYTPDLWSFIGSHCVGAAIIFATGFIIAGIIALILWIIDGPTKADADATDSTESEQSAEEADDEVSCKDPRCRCAYHYDEVFDRESGEWRLATDREMADRYQETLTSAN